MNLYCKFFVIVIIISHIIPSNLSASISQKRTQELERILRFHMPDISHQGRVSFLDKTFLDWLDRTGELPPDFDSMPSNPFLPKSLSIIENNTEIPIANSSQWKVKKTILKNDLQYYITGTVPPSPDNVKAKILKEESNGKVLFRDVQLTFGPNHKANLNINLYIPLEQKNLPVFLTQWNHREWGYLALRRGYAVCIVANADIKDDTEAYSEIWQGEYDFSALMRRAYGFSRAIDYLEMLPEVDPKKIGVTGHSRNAKAALWAAAFDDRIGACVSVSGGTGAEVPWRYNSHKYDVEDIAYLTSARPGWFHPRLKFFIGREHKLPVDQNAFMALVAPRGLMITSSFNEEAANLFGAEKAYHEARTVYDFLGAGDNIAVSFRYGDHGLQAKDVEEYIDFFDYIFKRSNRKPENKLYFNYSFEKWQKVSKININPLTYKEHKKDEELLPWHNRKKATLSTWNKKKQTILENLNFLLGQEPAGFENSGYEKLDLRGQGEMLFNSIIKRPKPTSAMKVMNFTPSRGMPGFGDFLYGYLYYPADKDLTSNGNKLPVVIYLHEYDFSKGFGAMALEHEIQSLFEKLTAMGYCVFAYDMAGFGNRIFETQNFYERYPHWSIMGKLVADARNAVATLANMNFIDSSQIYLSGYSLGGEVALFSAALDERIAGVVSVAGFTPMRTNTLDRGTEGLMKYSHLYGTIPQLGFFVGYENRVPVDFNEIVSCIAPRPLLVISPTLDRDAHLEDINVCMKQVEKIYKLHNASANLTFLIPDDYNRFTQDSRELVYQWLDRE